MKRPLTIAILCTVPSVAVAAVCLPPEPPITLNLAGEPEMQAIARQSFQTYWSEMGLYISCLNDEAASARQAVADSIQVFEQLYPDSQK